MWNGRLWSVAIPAELVTADERLRWTYVQAFVASNGHHGSAMIRCLREQYPGLGFVGFFGSTGSVGSSVSAKPISVTAVSWRPISADVSVCDKSSPSSKTHNHSQTPRPPSSRPAVKGGASDTGVRHRPSPRSSTSVASRSPVIDAKQRQAAVPRTTPVSKQGTGGWMGSTPTSGGVSRVVPHV